MAQAATQWQSRMRNQMLLQSCRQVCALCQGSAEISHPPERAHELSVLAPRHEGFLENVRAVLAPISLLHCLLSSEETSINYCG